MHSQPHPLVSVVLPAHNASQTILRALRSVAAQTYPNLELIVIDDASTDGTPDIVRGWTEFPVRLHRQESQSGASAARNKGIEIAKGEYIAFLDADDEWLPEKTKRQMTFLTADSSLSFITCEAWQVARDGTSRAVVNSGRERAIGPDAWKTLLRHPCVATPCVIVRRDKAKELGGFDATLPIAEDQDFWIRLALSGPVAHLNEELVRVYDRPNSLSKRQARNTAAITLPMVLKHLNENENRLTQQESKLIRRNRYTALGRNAYVEGAVFEGVRMLLKAIALGEQPVSNLYYLVFSSPMARFAKRLIQRTGTQ